MKTWQVDCDDLAAEQHFDRLTRVRGTRPAADDDSEAATAYWDRLIDEEREK